MFAATLGRFIGAVLAECAPVLVGIVEEAIRRATSDTVEDSAAPADLTARLLARLRGPDDTRKSGDAGTTPAGR